MHKKVLLKRLAFPQAVGSNCILLEKLKHERFWDADGNRKWAVFTFDLPSHSHIHIAKYLFSIGDE